MSCLVCWEKPLLPSPLIRLLMVSYVFLSTESGAACGSGTEGGVGTTGAGTTGAGTTGAGTAGVGTAGVGGFKFFGGVARSGVGTSTRLGGLAAFHSACRAKANLSSDWYVELPVTSGSVEFGGEVSPAL